MIELNKSNSNYDKANYEITQITTDLKKGI